MPCRLFVDPKCVGGVGVGPEAGRGREGAREGARGMLYLRNNSRGKNTEGVRATDEVQ